MTHDNESELLGGLLRALGEANHEEAVRHYCKTYQDAQVVEGIRELTQAWGTRQ
jgi:hypothetical protein